MTSFIFSTQKKGPAGGGKPKKKYHHRKAVPLLSCLSKASHFTAVQLLTIAECAEMQQCGKPEARLITSAEVPGLRSSCINHSIKQRVAEDILEAKASLKHDGTYVNAAVTIIAGSSHIFDL